MRGVDLGRVPAHGQPTAVHAAGCPSATDRAHPLGTMQALGVLARPGTTATACTVYDAAEAQMPVPLRAKPALLSSTRAEIRTISGPAPSKEPSVPSSSLVSMGATGVPPADQEHPDQLLPQEARLLLGRRGAPGRCRWAEVFFRPPHTDSEGQENCPACLPSRCPFIRPVPYRSRHPERCGKSR
ncbi:DUF6233 domain-containing protein [Streptomyces sp. NPDC001717]|uniref:DUF6233 domain-containing protein n=1 Tax=Streptomyces sp. NPDC001717 TaxID=3364604 RepID=UPI0036CF2764